MLVGPDQYVEVYNSIKDEFYSSVEKKVSVFVATDSCDSVCATKTLQVCLTGPSLRPWLLLSLENTHSATGLLQSILHRDSVPFALYPVTRYSEVQQLCKDLFAGSQVQKPAQLTMSMQLPAVPMHNESSIDYADHSIRQTAIIVRLLRSCGVVMGFAGASDLDTHQLWGNRGHRPAT